jgi:hypothetical protein
MTFSINFFIEAAQYRLKGHRGAAIGGCWTNNVPGGFCSSVPESFQ